MPIRRLKKDIKRHRPIDWFAILVLVSLTFVVISILMGKVDEFVEEMDLEAERLNADIIKIERHK